MALLRDNTTRAVEISLAVNRRRLHWIWRPGARDTVCGSDVFGRFLANARVNVTCPQCIRVMGLAAIAAARTE